MTKFKMSYYILLFLVILGTPVKIVYLEELKQTVDIHTYNNYYFFIEPYNLVNYKVNKTMSGTINYGLFAPPRLGHTGDEFKIIELSKNKNNNGDNSDINTYYEFYDKHYNSTHQNTNFIQIDNEKYCLISSNDETKGNDVINSYYIHSCYRQNEEWKGYYTKSGNLYCQGDVCIDEKKFSQIGKSSDALKMSCASINRFFEGANIVLDKRLSSDSYYVFRIIRPAVVVGNNFTVGDYFDPNNNNSMCPSSGENVVNPIKQNNDEERIYSPVLAKFSYKVTNYKCENKDFNKDINCNASNKIEQSCSKETIEIGNSVTSENARAEFEFSQTGVISNVLTPSKIYQGGGIKLGFTYYNTFEWKYLEGFEKGSNIDVEISKGEILKSIKAKVKDANLIKNDLAVDFNLDSIEKFNDIKSNMVKECTQTFSGDFESGSVTTICTVFLPVTNVQIYTGKINGVTASIGSGINNKMYTELNFTGTLNFSAVVSGLNVIKDGSDWRINYNPDENDKSCQVEVYSRLYKERNPGDKTNKFKFVYRPIDLDNPFPNRLAGANWYNWYSKDANKERLKNSYSKLQYQVELNPSRVNEIKKYNNGKKYFDWDGFDENGNGKSNFINDSDFKDYFPIKGQNIVGDSS